MTETRPRGVRRGPKGKEDPDPRRRPRRRSCPFRPRRTPARAARQRPGDVPPGGRKSQPPLCTTTPLAEAGLSTSRLPRAGKLHQPQLRAASCRPQTASRCPGTAARRRPAADPGPPRPFLLPCPSLPSALSARRRCPGGPRFTARRCRRRGPPAAGPAPTGRPRGSASRGEMACRRGEAVR